jgi:hypothetical protein
LNQEPWEDYCVEALCGQFNPVNPAIYSVLGELYQVCRVEPPGQFRPGSSIRILGV